MCCTNMRFVWILLGCLVHLSSVGVAAGPEGDFKAPKPWGERGHSNTIVQLLANGLSALGDEDKLWLSCGESCTDHIKFSLFYKNFKYDKDTDILTFERPVNSDEQISMHWDNGKGVTLDTVLELVECTLRERQLICDHFKWSAILFRKSELRLCSQHLNELELH